MSKNDAVFFGEFFGDGNVSEGYEDPADAFEPAPLQNKVDEPVGDDEPAEDEDKPFNMDDVADDVWEWASENAYCDTREVLRNVDEFVNAVLRKKYDDYVTYIIKKHAFEYTNGLTGKDAVRLTKELEEYLDGPDEFDVNDAAYVVSKWASAQSKGKRKHNFLYYVNDFLEGMLLDRYEEFIEYVAGDLAEELAEERVNERSKQITEDRAEERVRDITAEITDDLIDERARELAEEMAKDLVRRAINEKVMRGELILPSSEVLNGSSAGLWSVPDVEKLPPRSEAAKERTKKLVLEREKEHRKSLVAAFEQMVPPEYLNYPYDEYIVGSRSDLPRGVQREIRQFVEDATIFRQTLGTDAYQMAVVSGRRNGTGKTTTAIAIAREIVSRSLCSGAYAYASDALSRASYMYDEVIQELVSPRVLVIDDVGVSQAGMSDRQKDAFHYVIDQRWADPDKITIITTNLPFTSTEIETGLSGYVGRALWSRISDRLLMIEQNNGTHRGSGREDSEDDE